MPKRHGHDGEAESGWGLEEAGYSRDKFYVGGTDSHGHSGRARDIKVQPWLLDLIHRVIEDIPAYKGQVGNLARNALTHQVQHDIERIEDPRQREVLQREFRLHVDMEDQARHLQRYHEMDRYVRSCEVALPIYAGSGNWMMVTREIEKMKKNLEDAVLWEPYAGEVRQLVKDYEKKLRAAKKPSE